MTSVYERLKNLQITLRGVPPPVVDGYVAAFVPFVRTGNLIYLSGRLAKKNGNLWCGKLGEEITTAEGKQAARSVATELLATLQAAIGDLNDVRRIETFGLRQQWAAFRGAPRGREWRFRIVYRGC